MKSWEIGMNDTVAALGPYHHVNATIGRAYNRTSINLQGSSAPAIFTWGRMATGTTTRLHRGRTLRLRSARGSIISYCGNIVGLRFMCPDDWKQRTVVAGLLALVSLITVSGARVYADSSPPHASENDGSEPVRERTTEAPEGNKDSGIEPAISTSSRQAIEEVTVRGRKSFAQLRMELEAARDQVYDIFNEINSDDEFDIQCRRERQTGTRIPQRVCRMRFADDASSESAKEFMYGIFSNCGIRPGLSVGQRALFDDCAQFAISGAQVAQSETHYKAQLFAEKMQRLVQENPELRRAVLEYDALEREYTEAREQRRK